MRKRQDSLQAILSALQSSVMDNTIRLEQASLSEEERKDIVKTLRIDLAKSQSDLVKINKKIARG